MGRRWRLCSGALVAFAWMAVSSCAVPDPQPVTHPSSATQTVVDPVAARADVTYIMGCDDERLVRRPTDLVLRCDPQEGALHQLRWQRWGEDKATATGVLAQSDCVPDCRTGTIQRVPVTVVADQLTEGEGAATYRRMTVTEAQESEGMLLQQVYHLPGIEPGIEPGVDLGVEPGVEPGADTGGVTE